MNQEKDKKRVSALYLLLIGVVGAFLGLAIIIAVMVSGF